MSSDIKQGKIISQPLPPDKIVSSLIDFDIQVIQDYIRTFENSYKDGVKRLEQKYEDSNMDQIENEDEFLYYDYLVNYQDDFSDLEKVRKLSYLLSVVGLYSLVENTVKRITKLIYDDKIVEKKFDNFDNILTQLKHDKVCNIKTLSGYQYIDELRLINNCFKHNDSKVSKKLSNYAGWQEKEDINDNKNLEQTPEKMFPEIRKYILEFASYVAIKKKQLGKIKITKFYKKK